MPQMRIVVPHYHIRDFLNLPKGPPMSTEAYRWQMTAPKEPMVRTPFQAAPQAGEVTVAIAGCGVCHTDLGYYYDGVRTNQPLPLALGHEISGRVVAAGDPVEDEVERGRGGRRRRGERGAERRDDQGAHAVPPVAATPRW